MVVATTMTLDTTAPRVPVMARWAPITSLFMRLTRAPVWVRVKKPRGIRCTWSKSATLRSKMRPSPILEDQSRSKIDRKASPRATTTIRPAIRATAPRSSSGRATSMIWRISSGGTRLISAAKTMVARNPTSINR